MLELDAMREVVKEFRSKEHIENDHQMIGAMAQTIVDLRKELEEAKSGTKSCPSDNKFGCIEYDGGYDE